MNVSNNVEINLIEDIEATKPPIAEDVYIKKMNDPSFLLYKKLLENYFKEMISKKFNSKFNYFVNEDGDFEKKAISEDNNSENVIIKKPHYQNVEKRVNELNKLIKMEEYNLKMLRSKLLEKKYNFRVDFEKSVKKYNKLFEFLFRNYLSYNTIY